MAFATAIADSAQQSVAGQKRTANVEQGAGLLSTLIGTELWFCLSCCWKLEAFTAFPVNFMILHSHLSSCSSSSLSSLSWAVKV